MEAQFDNDKRELGNKLRQNPTKRIIAHYIGRAIFYSYFLFHPTEILRWSDKKFREFMLDYRRRVGMLEGAIFDNTLYIPNEQGTSLEYLTSVGGRWCGYDHTCRDKLELKDLSNRITDGKLSAFPLPEILDNSSQDYTPIGMVDPMEMTDIFQIVCPTIEELLECGFVERVAYKHAFSKIGIYEKYETNLFILGIADKPVYQVTPKGNGVIYLSKDSGDKEPKKLQFGVKVPSWAPT